MATIIEVWNQLVPSSGVPPFSSRPFKVTSFHSQGLEPTPASDLLNPEVLFVRCSLLGCHLPSTPRNSEHISQISKQPDASLLRLYRLVTNIFNTIHGRHFGLNRIFNASHHRTFHQKGVGLELGYRTEVQLPSFQPKQSIHSEQHQHLGSSSQKAG